MILLIKENNGCTKSSRILREEKNSNVKSSKLARKATVARAAARPYNKDHPDPTTTSPPPLRRIWVRTFKVYCLHPNVISLAFFTSSRRGKPNYRIDFLCHLYNKILSITFQPSLPCDKPGINKGKRWLIPPPPTPRHFNPSHHIKISYRCTIRCRRFVISQIYFKSDYPPDLQTRISERPPPPARIATAFKILKQNRPAMHSVLHGTIFISMKRTIRLE